MFMPAHKLAEMKMGDAGPREPTAHVFERKMDELEGNRGEYKGMKADLDKKGITTPLKIWHGEEGSKLMDGHHRLAHAMSKNPNTEIPIEHQLPDKTAWWLTDSANR